MKKLLDIYKKHQFLLLLLVNVLFVIFITSVFCWHYESNDDLVMAWIASGKFIGSPDYHLVFINAIYGFVLLWLYSVFPMVEWYTLFFLTFHVLSITIIAKWFLNLKIRFYLKIAILMLVYLIEVRMLLLLQFTTTAGILALAAFVLLLGGRKKDLVFGTLLFVLASLVRFQAAMLVGLVFCFFYPLYIYLFSFSLPQFLALIICLLLSVSFKIVDRRIYHSNPEWDYYYKYNEVRGKLNDNPNNWRAYDHLPDSVIKEDYKMLTWYFFPDPSILDLETLEKIHNTIETQTRFGSVPYIRKIKNIWPSMKGYLLYFLTLVPLFTFVVVGVEGRKRKLLYALCFVGLLLVFSWISMNAIVKERAFLCAYVAFLVFILVPADKVKISFSPVILAGVLIVIFGLAYKYLPVLKFPKDNDNSKEEQKYMLERIGKPVVLGELFTSSSNPMRLQDDDFNVPLYASGWTTLMPKCDCVNSYKELIIQSIPIVIGYDKGALNDVCETLQTSILFHYNIETSCRILMETENYVVFCLK